MKSRTSWLALLILGRAASGGSWAEMYEAPKDVRQTGDARFTSPPAAVREGGGMRIRFAVSATTDVEVAVVDAQGRIVRHLAAGLLGKNAPMPLKKDSLSQELLWDGKDDAGKPAAGGPFKVRVRAGAKAELDKIAGWDGNTFGGAIEALTVGNNGEVFVLLTDHFRGRAEIRVLDRQGKYLRTIMPYQSNAMLRFDPQCRPLPFSATGSHKIEGIEFRSYGLDMGLRGHRIAPNGDIYVLRSKQKTDAAWVETYGPDGKHQRTLISGLNGGDCGLGLDACGNVYVAINVKRAQQPFPADFMGQIPTERWLYWKTERKPPWQYLFCNPYLNMMGSVFKFGPEGGKLYGDIMKPLGGKKLPLEGPLADRFDVAAWFTFRAGQGI